MSSAHLHIHSAALVESREIGEGTRIWAFAHVCKGAVVGANCNIGDGCYLEGGSRIGDNVTVKNGVMIWEGVQIGDGVFIGPGVVFTNDLHPRSPRLPIVRKKYASKGWLQRTHVARGASIGAQATLNCGIFIGQYAMIGAAAMVTDDVAPYTIVVGNPARPCGYVCACGEPITFRRNSATCSECGAKYRQALKGVESLD